MEIDMSFLPPPSDHVKTAIEEQECLRASIMAKIKMH